MEREKEKVVEAEKNEDCDEMCDGISASATDQDEGAVDEAGQPQVPMGKVDNALKTLVYNATEEFGFSPRDVYNGVLRLSQTREDHAAAVKNFDYAELRKIEGTFSMQHGLASEHSRVVVVFPPPTEMSRLRSLGNRLQIHSDQGENYGIGAIAGGRAPSEVVRVLPLGRKL